MADNPMAFPFGDQGGFAPEFGMTLRDWFAGQIAVPLAVEVTNHLSVKTEDEPRWVASRAYQIADAMLAERAKAGAA